MSFQFAHSEALGQKIKLDFPNFTLLPKISFLSTRKNKMNDLAQNLEWKINKLLSICPNENMLRRLSSSANPLYTTKTVEYHFFSCGRSKNMKFMEYYYISFIFVCIS